MSVVPTIKVKIFVSSTRYMMKQYMEQIRDLPLISFDVETRSMYEPYEREEAKEFLKDNNVIDDMYRLANLVQNSSGLSHPSVIRTTHFIVGTSRDSAYVLIARSEYEEMMLWEFFSEFKGTMLVHNSLFDLRIMFNRLGKFPPNIIDTALLAKCLTNHVDIWKCKTGLKELMGAYYAPKWSKLENYEPKNLKDPDFIEYAGIDGAATFHLYELIQEEIKNGN